MIKIEIKNRWTGKILFEYQKENNNVRETILEAIKSGANLRYADLSGANLRYADLSGANLRYADLSGANLRYADLSGANLRGADLSGADLSSANLSRADLSRADLSGANLSDADLSGADLSGAVLRDAVLSRADLSGAVLRGAVLSEIKKDYFDVLLRAIPEVTNFKKALLEGRINGSTCEGDCACLCGTLMKSENKIICNRIDKIKDSNRPIEKFFLCINQGDTPENNQFSKLALEWLEEFEVYINPVFINQK